MSTLQLAITYTDGTVMYFDAEVRWRLDAMSQTLIVGKGTNRSIIPFMNIRFISFSNEKY